MKKTRIRNWKPESGIKPEAGRKLGAGRKPGAERKPEAGRKLESMFISSEKIVNSTYFNAEYLYFQQ